MLPATVGDLGDIAFVDLAIRSRGVSQLKFAKADTDELRRAGVSHAERRG